MSAQRIGDGGRDGRLLLAGAGARRDLFAGLTHPLFAQYLVPVILPMGLFNVLGSLQNIESAEAAGDRYPTMPCLAVNGIGSIVAALFGSCFPTTIYIGHPGWKALGARSGYSILNGVFFALAGAVRLDVPDQRARADRSRHGDRAVDRHRHHGAGLPGDAAPSTRRRSRSGCFRRSPAGALLVLTQTLGAAGNATHDPGLAARVLAEPRAFAHGRPATLHGLVALSQGFMLTCMIWSAISAHLIDRQVPRAPRAGQLIGAVLAFFGFIHAGIADAGRRHLRHRLGERLALVDRLRGVRAVLPVRRARRRRAR